MLTVEQLEAQIAEIEREMNALSTQRESINSRWNALEETKKHYAELIEIAPRLNGGDGKAGDFRNFGGDKQGAVLAVMKRYTGEALSISEVHKKLLEGGLEISRNYTPVALNRLCKRGSIHRVADGIYQYETPQCSA